MHSLGRHELVELYDCDHAILDDEVAIAEHMLAAARAAGATIVGERVHKFNPHGVSGVVILAESHLTIHTWPEHGYAALDLFTCSDIDSDACFALLKKAFKARHHVSSVVSRGVRDEIVRHTRPRSFEAPKGLEGAIGARPADVEDIRASSPS